MALDFIEKLRDLILRSPRNAVHSRNVDNCAFGDYLYRSKNAYLSYYSYGIEDCFYCEFSGFSRDCTDCSYIHNCELCYECFDCANLYQCSYLQDCHNCSNSYYSVDLINCQDCFGCFGLRHQRFAIFNKVYTEDIYRQKLAKLVKNPPFKILEGLLPALKKHPRLSSRLLKGEENCLGDYIYWSKNVYYCFNVRSVEDSGYLFDLEDTLSPTRDSYDCFFGGGLELSYECTHSAFSNNCNFMESCSYCNDCEYCFECYSCRNCFGCSYLMNKEYCILNNPFSRSEYIAAVDMIKKELKQTGSYGKTFLDILV